MKKWVNVNSEIKYKLVIERGICGLRYGNSKNMTCIYTSI